MGHWSGWWRVWNCMGWVSRGSRSGGYKAISSCINNFSLHFLSEGTTCVTDAVKRPIGSVPSYATPLFEILI